MTPAEFQYVTVHSRDSVLVLTITESRIGSGNVPETLGQELIAAFEQGGFAKVIVDLQNVKMVYAVGLQPLLNLHRKVVEQSAQLILCGLSSMVTELMQTTGLIAGSHSSPSYFETESDVPSALARLNAAVS